MKVRLIDTFLDFFVTFVSLNSVFTLLNNYLALEISDILLGLITDEDLIKYGWPEDIW